MKAHVALLVVVPALLSLLLIDPLPALLAIPATFATFYTTLVSSIILYRVGPFHPLARYPGPLLAKVSKFWMAYIASGKKQHLYIQNLHAKYGDVVRIGMSLSITTSS